MIYHLVLFKFKKDAETALINKMYEQLLTLKNIEGVREISLGKKKQNYPHKIKNQINPNRKQLYKQI